VLGVAQKSDGLYSFITDISKITTSVVQLLVQSIYPYFIMKNFEYDNQLFPLVLMDSKEEHRIYYNEFFQIQGLSKKIDDDFIKDSIDFKFIGKFSNESEFNSFNVKILIKDIEHGKIIH